MKHIATIDAFYTHTEDIFSTESIEELFLSNTARVIESEILTDISFIDTTSSSIIPSDIHVPYYGNEDESSVPSSHISQHIPENVLSTQDTIEVDDIDSHTISNEAIYQIEEIDSNIPSLLEAKQKEEDKSIQEHVIMSSSSLVEITEYNDTIQILNGDFIVPIQQEDIETGLYTSSPLHSTDTIQDTISLSFTEEVQLANKKYQQREQDEQEYRIKKQIQKEQEITRIADNNEHEESLPHILSKEPIEYSIDTTPNTTMIAIENSFSTFSSS